MINLSRNYARALVRYAKEQGALEEIHLQAQSLLRDGADFADMAGLLVQFLAVVPPKSRRSVLRRTAVLAKRELGVEDVLITTAHPLADGQQERIVARFERIIGKRLYPAVLVDPGLIGGVRILAAGRLYEESIQGSITQLNRVMKGVLINHVGG